MQWFAHNPYDAEFVTCDICERDILDPTLWFHHCQTCESDFCQDCSDKRCDPAMLQQNKILTDQQNKIAIEQKMT